MPLRRRRALPTPPASQAPQGSRGPSPWRDLLLPRAGLAGMGLSLALAFPAACAAASPSPSASAPTRAAPAASAAPASVPAAGAGPAFSGLKPCRLPGVEHAAQCGTLRRPLDPSLPQGVQIDVHVAVLPALARYKRPDPVAFFAGGPGQSAIAMAGMLHAQFARLATRRDFVFVDLRGTGRSAPLMCPEAEPAQPLRERVDTEAARARLAACRAALERLPHGDLRRYTTTLAVQDVEAVRQALGAPALNVMGASYGTRAALEYARQFPQAVRRMVLDGVAPPDMVLPLSFGEDAQAAFDAVLRSCENDAPCRARHPNLHADWSAMLASLPRPVTVRHPVTGLPETLTLTREAVTALVRTPLYVPALAAGLPHAVSQAAQGCFEPLVGLGVALGGGERALRLAEGLHFSVVCAEDAPRLPAAPAGAAAPESVFREPLLATYREACRDWPRGEVPEAFYTVSQASAPTLVLSGGADPVTPPRHGERVARALGAQARHVVVPHAGHGLLAIGCLRDAVVRFVQAEDAAAAQAVELGCAKDVPRPPAWRAPGASTAASAARSPR
jgi:pimeloyl-ACP methyl ester carboxylesterase